MKKLILLFVFTAITNCSFGQSSTKEITDAFFVKFASNPLKAFEYAFSTNEFFDQKSDGVKNLKNQFKNVTELCGKYKGSELITKKPIGQSIEMVTYLLKYERQPIKLTFYFYKPSDTWQVQNLAFLADFDKELDESVLLNKLSEGK